MDVEFYNSDVIPDELNYAQSRFSIDVLCHFPSLDEHTIGWFDFIEWKWLFLRNQDYTDKEFQWRYFVDEIDKKKFE